MTDKEMKGAFPGAVMTGEGQEIDPAGNVFPLRARCPDAFDRIIGEKERKKRILVAIDGPCASGKTTLALALAGAFGAGVVHTDDFVIPHWMKTPDRLQIPGGNLEDERLIGEVLEPWKKGESGIYRRYDCHDGRYVPAGQIPGGDVFILEGSYALLPSVRRYADVPLFVTAPLDVREERLKKRESQGSFKRFMDLWIPLENAYFDACGLPDGDCTVIMG